MQKHHQLIAVASLLAGASLSAQTAPAASAPADALTTALTKGKVSLNVRARYENVDQTGLKDANAVTIRTRLGYTTAPLDGFQASVELENVTAVDGDAYSQAGINPGGAGKAVVADPEGAELNQAWLAYTFDEDTTIKVGRSQYILDNARFVGDVGWRQNNQTFDGIFLSSKAVEKVVFNYAYLDQINRVFGDKHAQGDWGSKSHLVNVAYSGLPLGTITAYAYLLDFDDPTAAAGNSCATYGASFVGAYKLSEDYKLGYRAEFAKQTDYGSSSLNYNASYYVGELGLVAKKFSVAGGYEVLGSDNNVGFKTPLATLHAFNGWADVFLATPAGGLEDIYGKVSASLPGKIGFLGFYHVFNTDTGIDLGKEFDLQLTHKFGKYFTGLVKYADFERDGSTTLVPDSVKKFWVQVEFAF